MGPITNGWKETSSSRDGIGIINKGPSLLLNKIAGPTVISGTGVPLFGPKVSSPKGAMSAKNVFLVIGKEAAKMKNGKSPKRKLDG